MITYPALANDYSSHNLPIEIKKKVQGCDFRDCASNCNLRNYKYLYNVEREST